MVPARAEDPVELECAVQCYDWGIVGEESLVARIHCANVDNKIDPARPYAEVRALSLAAIVFISVNLVTQLWMGTHESGPSLVKAGASRRTLREHLGHEDLPFLFKVLSVRKALSIQAHPDRPLARILHARDPHNYRDANHKPEMTIALTDFEALCGFRSIDEIAASVQRHSPLAALLGPDICAALSEAAKSRDGETQRATLKTAFTRLMNCPQDVVTTTVRELSRQATTRENSEDADPLLSLLARLMGQFPDDVGGLCVFFLHHLKLAPGQAIFLAANEPHAYLAGSCVECMATSDNVVRAGLTPKYRDVDTLCSMLTYTSFSRVEDVFEAPRVVAGRPFALLYAPPVTEFAVFRIHFPAAGQSDCVSASPVIGRSIVLCVEGEAELVIAAGDDGDCRPFTRLHPGKIVYLPARLPFALHSIIPNTLLFQAFEPQ